MTIIYQTPTLTLELHDYAHGSEYRLTDGVDACTLSEMPEEKDLDEIWYDYKNAKFDGIIADTVLEMEDEVWER